MPQKISSSWSDEDKGDQQLTQYAIPDGEGFNALPIAFNTVIASLREAITN